MRQSRRSFLSTLSGAAALPTAAAMSAATTQAPALRGSDPLGVRQDFPVASRDCYLNSAYIAPTPLPVMEAGRTFADAKGHAPISLGDMLAKADTVRAQYARLINAKPSEVGFLFSTSEGENVVAAALDLTRGDNVVIDELHYQAEFVLYKHLETTRGVELRVAKANAGAVTVRELEPLVDRRTKLVSVAWVSHQNGYRHDMRALAELAHARGAFFYTDAIQAVGMFPVDVRAAGVDAMASGTYKWLLASYGVAPFYVREEMLERVRLDRYGALHVERDRGGYQYDIYETAKKFDYSTLAFGPVYQLGAALEYLERVGVARIEAHTVALTERLARGLRDRGFDVKTPEGNRSSILAFGIRVPAERATRVFDEAQVRVSVREQGTQVRVSPALFNVDSDIDRFLAVADALRA